MQLREVYNLVTTVRTEIMSELAKLDAHWDRRLSAHESEHDKDSMRRSSLIRWAVTSVLTGIGVMISLYYALR